MFQTTNGRNPIGEAVWVLAGIIMLMAFGDALIVLLVVLAAAAMGVTWWIYRNVERGAEGDDAALAPVTQLRPGVTHGPSADAPRRGPRAA
jgi:uncharacterized membrane protein